MKASSSWYVQVQYGYGEGGNRCRLIEQKMGDGWWGGSSEAAAISEVGGRSKQESSLPGFHALIMR